MTDATQPDPSNELPPSPDLIAGPPTPENVRMGSLFALATIPVGVAIYGIVGGVIGLISGLVALVIPSIAVWFYERGAGAKLTRAGWAPYIAISITAIVLGIFAGFVGTAYAAFTAVGGDGLFGAAFWTTVRNQLTSGDALLPILLGLGLGALGLFGVLRTPRVK